MGTLNIQMRINLRQNTNINKGSRLTAMVSLLYF